MSTCRKILTVASIGMASWLCVALLWADDAPRDIGSRRELFTDDWLVDGLTGQAAQRLHSPTPREVAFRFDQPWEGNASGYATVMKDGEKFRMWYRGHRYILDGGPLRQAQTETVCYAESEDGVTWNRPSLGIWEWNGSKENNIIHMGDPAAHNFAPFKDTRPDCPADERYKALGGTTSSKGLLGFKSADGVHWTRIQEAPIFTKGIFDSHNTVFWDAARGRYTLFFRFFSGGGEGQGLRLIGTAHSSDFFNWSDPVVLEYPHSPPQQMYTNQIAPYYRAPHVLLGFPTRFVARPLSEHARRLEPVDARAKFVASIAGSGHYTGAEVTDGLFMSSRDGVSFRRWDEAFLRPGPEAEGRWIYGDNYQSYGLFETTSSLSGTREISMHFNEGAWRDEAHRLRRYSLRLDGFVSIHAPLAGGELMTRPFKFSGNRLSLNYATSAAGSVKVEMQSADGAPLMGYTLADADELFGDSTDHTATWRDNPDVGALAGKTVRLRFVLKDADLYAMRFKEGGTER